MLPSAARTRLRVASRGVCRASGMARKSSAAALAASPAADDRHGEAGDEQPGQHADQQRQAEPDRG